MNRRGYPLGAAVTLEELDTDPHPALHRLRRSEPVSWLPALDGWLVTRHDLAVAAMRDARTFTVQDERFSTGRVIGPSMLSLDGEAHARHRGPFVGPFRAAEVSARFQTAVAAEAQRLVSELAGSGGGELRRGFAGPLAAATMTIALGLDRDQVGEVLAIYDAIVASVTSITARQGPTAAGEDAYTRLRARLAPVIAGARNPGSLLAAAAAGSELGAEEVASNAAVLLFGGIETTEGMVVNAAAMLLEHPAVLAAARGDPPVLEAAIDESLRLEPAAAVIDRYATTDTRLGGADIRAGELVRISLAGANRDPAVFADPDAFDPGRPRRGNLAFAQGPHVCVGVHLARLEARIGLAVLLERLPRLRATAPARAHGLVFRKPVRLEARWD